MSPQVEHAVTLLRAAQQTVVFTGAGLSTESGIPDFRSPGGVWEKFQPIMYQEFLRSAEARKAHWAYKRATAPVMMAAVPNPGHVAIAQLEQAGRVSAVVTQNIDTLHQRAGSQRVLELHGTNAAAVCLDCQQQVPIADALAQLDAGADVPTCAHCRGWLKPATISFGQSLPEDVLQEAVEVTRAAECFLAVGSSLVVNPAASLAGLAKQHGAHLIIVTLSDTPYDDSADVVIREKIGTVLPQIVAAVCP